MSIRNLTKHMVELLMDCHEREVLQQQPFHSLGVTRSARALLNRGLLKTDTYTVNERTFISFRITRAGKEYLDKNQGEPVG